MLGHRRIYDRQMISVQCFRLRPESPAQQGDAKSREIFGADLLHRNQLALATGTAPDLRAGSVQRNWRQVRISDCDRNHSWDRGNFLPRLFVISDSLLPVGITAVS